MGYKIRRTNDLKAVHGLCDRLIGKNLRHERPKNAYWLVYSDKGNPVGFGIATPVNSDEVFLSRSGVMPHCKGNNLQVRLIKVREQWARNQGYKYLITYTTIDNGPSIKSLLKCGFKIYVPDWRWAGDDMIYYVKKIEPIVELPRL